MASNVSGKLIVRGVPYTGQSTDTLRADTSLLVDADGFGEFAYSWKLNNVIEIGTGDTLAFDSGWFDSGFNVTLTVSYVDGSGSAESITSQQIYYGTSGNDTFVATDVTGGFYLGMEGNDTMTGNVGNDTLNGAAGNDSMIGGIGDDMYYVQQAGDVVVEAANEGYDRVVAFTSTTLTANVERLDLNGSDTLSGFGNSMDNVINGNSAANLLRGYDGNDTINGGAGVDTMYGGLGDDVFIVDDAGDLIGEFAGQGTDTVISSISLTLRPNLENLTLKFGAGDINGYGNTLDNLIVGNEGNNILDGRDGADTMKGGAGDDIYYISSEGDVAIESDLVGGGTDLARVSVDYTMGYGIENAIMVSTLALDITGNSLDNTITGNESANVLNGGAGADTMSGSGGDDTYYVDNAGDVVIEGSSYGGYDTVYSTVDFVMSNNLDVLYLDGIQKINGTGNFQDNSIIGNSSANQIDGAEGNDTLTGGGAYDTLTGGEGADTFVYTSMNDTGVLTGNRDIITDFVSGTDKIDLSAFLFGDTVTVLDSAATFSTIGEVQLKNEVLFINLDTDAEAEMAIDLTGVTSVAAGDFILGGLVP